MKTELLHKLKELSKKDDVLSVQKDFNQLSAQLKSLMAHDDSDDEEDGHEEDTDESLGDVHQEDEKPDSDGDLAERPSDSEVKNAKPTEAGSDEKAPPRNEEKNVNQVTSNFTAAETENPKPEKVAGSDAVQVKPESEKGGQEGNTDAATTEISPEKHVEAEASQDTRDEAGTSSDKSDAAEATEGKPDSADALPETTDSAKVTEGKPDSAEATESKPSSVEATEGKEEELSVDEAKQRYEEIANEFKAKTKKAREEKKKSEDKTVEDARTLLKEMQELVANEENIGKAFNRFNEIQDQWKALPKVSNKAYRDLNVEYSKYLEQFFYNINIYKELKELDLKHNLDQKQAVVENQKKLLDINDIRLLEVEVRMNQERWNEIGPTFREEWDKIKDEFWTITRAIYKKIQAFYDNRREDQGKNLEAKQELLNKARHIESLDLRNHKSWQDKTEELKSIQKEWKMIGHVPRSESRKIWKEFRSVCDSFFDTKREHYNKLHEEQDANRDRKQELVDLANALKDSEDFKEASQKLIQLQKDWKKIGNAHHKDEKKLWRKFRGACDHFFNRRNEQKAEQKEEFKENLAAKEALLEEMEKFEPGTNRDENIEALKGFSSKWRDIGFVPFKVKDKVNSKYKSILESNYGKLNIDRKEKEKIRFEQKLKDIQETDGKSDDLARKEENHIRKKISSLKEEVIQLENNIGFFANSKGTEKMREEVESKIDNAKDQIDTLKKRLSMLRDA